MEEDVGNLRELDRKKNTLFSDNSVLNLQTIKNMYNTEVLFHVVFEV